jgi:hypothetical protein
LIAVDGKKIGDFYISDAKLVTRCVLYFILLLPLAGLPDFSWLKHNKTRKNIRSIQTIPNGFKIYQHFPFQDPPNYTKIPNWSENTYINHLATLSCGRSIREQCISVQKERNEKM